MKMEYKGSDCGTFVLLALCFTVLTLHLQSHDRATLKPHGVGIILEYRLKQELHDRLSLRANG